ncbi:YycH family regulatory protein [Staphylococcus canis]|uniref:Regulatory protein YycH domain-containing protein n=1 Tax=Staphylococcus canis TaxID=2724942 RepID=A0ABS0T8B1_9STAP|nr:two-component system activity regulator YycH [Staphylococcus canis]MBI5974993.1 hypothetical protein [Staphylococcus canis]
MRTKEIIKTILLILLVASSMVLTFKIWNFSPDLTDADTSSQDQTTKAIGPRFDHDFDEVITPLQMIHVTGSKFNGLPADKQVHELLNELQDQQITKVEDIQNEQVILLRELSDNLLVLDYPTDTPLTVYLNDIFDISAKVPEQFMFDRLVFDLDSRDDVVIYALQENRQRAIKLTTSISTKTMKQKLQGMKQNLVPYTAVMTNRATLNEATYLYAPQKPKHIQSYRTIFNSISIEDLNAILFDDTPIVRTANSGNMTYNNNTGVVNYDIEKQTYSYSNLSEDDLSMRNMTVSIPRTIDFINKHGGFTDDFRLFQTNAKKGEITYQMFQDGRPVFYDSPLNQIRMIWGERGISEYNRGLLKTNVTIDNGEKNLESVEKVRAGLIENNAVDFAHVQHMIVGYRMKTESGPESTQDVQNSSQFVPAWFIQYNHTWYEYEDGELTAV